MDSNRFDRLTRKIATGLTRRSLLGGATAAGAASMVGMSATSDRAQSEGRSIDTSHKRT